MSSHRGRHSAGRGYMPLPGLIAVHVLCIAVGLLVFAYFHHVRDYLTPAPSPPVSLYTPAPLTTPTPAAANETASGENTPQPTTEPVSRGMFGDKFPGKFTGGEVIRTENSYMSEHINVTLTRIEKTGLVCHVAEIYITDTKYLRTAFGEKGYGYRGMAADLAAANNAIVAISGDYFAARKEGVVIRNGVLYRETRFEDICALLSDGRMLTLPAQGYDLEELKSTAPWQVWSFGPMLLENGEAKTEFNSTVVRKNPRAAIGCVEPGHYFFVQVDGRGAFSSQGLTLGELASLFEELGCTTAYNLDGGQTAGMVWNGELVSYPYGRSVSDIIYIAELPEEEED